MVLPVYLYGHPVIRKETEEIDASYPQLKELIENMYETMYATEGIGLAAPQIGLSIRLIVIDVNPMAEYFPECADVKLTLINPVLEVLEDGSKETREEGCLSLPGIHEPVPRIEKIRLPSSSPAMPGMLWVPASSRSGSSCGMCCKRDWEPVPPSSSG